MPMFIILYIILAGIFSAFYIGIALLSCWLFQRKTISNPEVHGFISALIPFLLGILAGLAIDFFYEADGGIFFLFAIISVLCLLSSPLICVLFCKKLARKNQEREK